MRKILLTSILALLACLARGQSYSYRYWIDNNVSSAVSGSGTGETEFNINTSTLTNGFHILHIQAQNDTGVWSSVRTRYFLRHEEGASQVGATARYWIDNDLTTMHNGVATSGIIELDIPQLSIGLHAVHYQKIAANGTPSSVRTRYFIKHEEASHTGATARYWIDNDLTTMHNGVATSGIIELDISKLDIGMHTVHYQKIASDGTPSPVRTRFFLIDRLPDGKSYSAHISIDDGEATVYPVTGEEIVIDLGELEGEHMLHVALYDEENRLVGEQTQTFDAGQRTHFVEFADANMKAICVENWDTDGDGEFSEDEAAAVTDIGDAFSGHENITSLNDLRYFTGLTSIPDLAFAKCIQMQSIVIPKNVQTIGTGIFYCCNALTSVTVDEENPYFDSRGDCNAVIETATNTLVAGCKTTVIPDDVKAIGDLAFYHIHGLTSLPLPQGLTSIGLGAFFGCIDLPSLTIPKSVVSIDDEVVGNCNVLQTLVVEEGNTVYDSRNQCNAIIETATNTLIAGCIGTVIPESVTAISDYAFDICPITRLNIPSNVRAIDDYALRLCTSLQILTVDDSNTVYDSRGGCNAIMETATDRLLFGCMNTEIPEDTRSIAEFAFTGCDRLQQVVLPSTLTAIGESAFEGCDSLELVVAYMKQPLEISEKTFTNRNNATLYVPYDCKALYEAAAYWKEFEEIIEMEPEKSPNIEFADANVKAICVDNWDTDGDGELSEDEAAAVTAIGNMFQQTAIISFDELRYFTGLTSISGMAFALCQQLQSIVIPRGVTNVGGGLFYKCYALTSVKVDEENPVLDSRNNCNAIIETATGTLLAGCKTTKIPDDVTAIGDMAFYHVHGLTDLVLPQGLKSIGLGSLFGLIDQVSLVIPKSVTEIGVEAFGNMNALSSLVVEQGNMVYDSRNDCNAVIETATNMLISGCKTTVIPNTVTAIDYCAFDSQPITQLNIPASVIAIDELAVRLCGGLSSITVDAGNTVYDSRGGCNAIMETATGQLLLGCKNTVIPETTRSIGNYAFQGYDDLEEVLLPKSITAIGTNAFDGCDNLTTVISYMQEPPVIVKSTFTNRANATLYVPYGCKAIYAVADCWKDFNPIVEMEPSGPKLIEFADANVKAICVSNWDSNGDGELDTEEAAAVTTLGTVFKGSKDIESFDELEYFTGLKVITDYAFQNCIYLKSVQIPANVETVGKYAFNGCTGLKKVNLPEGLTTLGTYAFSGCKALVSVVIPSSLPTIGDYAFYNCSALKSVTLQEGLVTIGDYSFTGCTLLPSIAIPSTVKDIGIKAFANCEDLETVTMTSGVKTIGNYCFQKCTSLTAVSISTDIVSIGNYAFDDCARLKKVEIPEGLTTLGTYAFSGCKALVSVVIPSSLPTIGDYAFYNCSALKSVTLQEGLVTIGDYSFTGCTLLPSIAIPSTVKEIGIKAFANCEDLQTVTMTSGVKTINNYAFQGCKSLKSITLPETIQSIGNYAFHNCSQLTVVTALMKEPVAISQYTFSNRTNATLYVPIGCKSLYEVADFWKEFKTIVEGNAAIEDETNDVLFASDLEVMTGTKVALPIALKNDDEVKLCQFDLLLPNGVTVVTKSNGKLDANLTERAETHSIASKQLENGSYRFIISSMDNDSFTGNSGTLIEVTLDIPTTMESGEYTVKLINAELSVADGTDLKVVKPANTESKLTVKSYLAGDVNNDGSVSVTDVGCTINYILEMVPSVFIFDAADMNNDKTISVTDVGMIINYILNDGAAPNNDRAAPCPMLNRRTVENTHLFQQQTNDGYLLQLENKDAIIGFQMDLQLAAGVTLNGMKLISGDDHLITYRKLSNGIYRVVCYSPTNSNFVANNHALLKISATGDVSIDNIRLTTVDLTEITIDGINTTATDIADVGGFINENEELKVYTLDGRLYRTTNKQSGKNPHKGLKAGIYMVGNRKVIIR